jgi:surface antigen
MRRILIIVLLLALLGGTAWYFKGELPLATRAALEPGSPLDSLHGVIVYHNGSMGNVSGRNVVDGSNVGLRYQCVEFVKRYYLEHYGHRMPNSYGHAKDLFNSAVKDGELNTDRGLRQYTNPSGTPPQVGDLVVFDGWRGNPYGHVAIVSAVEHGEVEVVQQNTGSTRATFDLDLVDGRWRVDERRILGWLGKR